MTDQEFAVILELGGEQTGVEFKSGGTISDKHLLSRVVRAMLSMANRRDGGVVILGVDSSKTSFKLVGFSQYDVTEWSRDNIGDKAAPLADPSLSFKVEHKLFQNRWYVVISIEQFSDTPVFSRTSRNDEKNSEVILREGALYVRSRRKPETYEVRTSEEMRELIELSVNKRLRSFMKMAENAGITFIQNDAVSDSAKFAAEIGEEELR